MPVIHPPTQPTAAAPAQAASGAAPLNLLLLEPQFLLRRTVASVARDMRLAEPHESTSVDAAARLLAVRRFDALFISLDDEDAAVDLLRQVREGSTQCDAQVPIAVTAGACSTSLALRLKTLEVRRLLLRPFKVKSLLEAIAGLRPLPPPLDKAA